MQLATLVTAGLFHIIHCFDFLIFESNMMTTFEYNYEGFGFFTCVGYPALPFTMAVIARYALEHGIDWSLWQVITVWCFFLPALFIYRAANSQKHRFRTNPYDPSVSCKFKNIIYLKKLLIIIIILDLDSIPTARGKKLLISGYWGKIRHPNYAADIVMQLCMYSLVPCVPAVIPPLGSIFVLLHRLHRDGKRCERKYGPAWERYCHCVKYKLIPKVY